MKNNALISTCRTSQQTWKRLFSAFLTLFYLGTGQVWAAKGPDPSELMSRVDQAIAQAQQKLNYQIPEEAKRGLSSSQESAAAPSQSPTKAEKAEAKSMMRTANEVYNKEKDYQQAFEMSETVLRLDPKNKQAKALQDRFERDLDKHMANTIPTETTYVPPDGVLTYKTAVSDGLITLQESIDIALKSNLKLKSLEHRIKGAEFKLNEAKRALYPTIEGEIDVNGGVLAGNAYTGEAFKINASQPMFYGGELLLTIRQAEANLSSDKIKLEKERLDVTQQVTEAYHAVVNAEYNFEYQTLLFADVEHYRNIINKAHDQKLVAEIEWLETESFYNQSLFQREAASSALQSANLALYEQMGVSGEAALPVEKNLNYFVPSVNLEEFLKMVRTNNPDIKIKEMAAKSAEYNLRVYDARKLPRVDVRGSMGLQGEVLTDHATGPDLEKEHYIGVNASVPWDAHTGTYSYQRRFFGPTVSSFLGSEDFRHVWKLGLWDNMANLTDEQLAKADYLLAKDEYQKERVTQEIAARQIYFDLQNAVLNLQTSESKLGYHERQVEILKHMTAYEENSTSDLLEEMVSLAEDRFSRVASISDIITAVAKMNRIIGIEGYYDHESGK